METYICSDVPPVLYRIDYPGSGTTWTSQEGFKATDTSRAFGGKDLLDFKRSIEKSLTWSYRTLCLLYLSSPIESTPKTGVARSLGSGIIAQRVVGHFT